MRRLLKYYQAERPSCFWGYILLFRFLDMLELLSTSMFNIVSLVVDRKPLIGSNF